MVQSLTFILQQPILRTSCALGEGPFFTKSTNELRFVDIYKQEIHFFDPNTSSHTFHKLPDSVGVTADIRDVPNSNRFIVAAKFGFAVYDRSFPDTLRYIAKVHTNP